LLPGLLGVVCTLLVYALVRRTLDEGDAAFLAALVYVTTPEVAHWSRGVHLETLVTMWVLLGLFAAYRSVTEPSAVLWLAVAAIGGWFAKGPQGLFPVAVAIVLWAQAGVLTRRTLSAWSAAGVALAVATLGPWLAARLGEGSGFAHAYFGGQIRDVLFETCPGLPRGVTELFAHPVLDGEELRGYDRHHADIRVHDAATLTDPSVTALLDQHGIQRISYRELRAVQRARSA